MDEVVQERSVSFVTEYVTVSIPSGVAKSIDKLIERLGYWPSRSAFVREACLQKIREEKQRLERT